MRASFLVALLFLLTALAGCLGGDEDVEGGDDGTDPVVSETTGALKGRVGRNFGIDPIQGATVNLILDGTLIGSATSNAEGDYAINNIEPGGYRMQVTALCCHAAQERVEVKANEVTTKDFDLVPFEEPTVGKPYHDYDTFTGFYSCMVVAGGTGTAPCSFFDDKHDVAEVLSVEVGLETLTVAMEWEDPALTASGSEMELEIANNKTAWIATGTSPIQIQIHNSDLLQEDPDNAFSTYEDPWLLEMTAVLKDDPGFVYQLPVKIHWSLHYWEPAPAGYSALPDA